MNADDELLEAFLEESTENLDQFDLDLVELEAHPDDPEPLTRVFRTLHTLKGTCGFLGLPHLEGLAHAGEDLLAAIRAGDLALSADIITTLLALGDRVRSVLDRVAEHHDEGGDDHADLVARLRAPLRAPGATEPEPAPQQVPVPAPETAPPPAAEPQPDNDAQPIPQPPASTTAPADHPSQREDATVRIDVAVLDQLQDLVGELTLARMRLDDEIGDESPLAAPFARLTAITRDLQGIVMQARLQPIATATSRLHRVVRDLAATEGKQVRLVITGEDVTVDKAINETLRDPLLHLVRNAVDHGIETPEQRRAAGKPAGATVRIDAALVGGGVQLDVSDDGGGIDTDRVVEKAIAAGRLTAAEASALTTRARQELLFLPGVSTAEAVTTVSGRGVGMDVVRAALEQIGGSIEVTTIPGEGTSFRISVPLTLAILPALIVHCGGNRFTLPQADVVAVMRVPASDFRTRLRTIGGATFLRHRGELLPLIDAADYLALTAHSDRSEQLDIIAIRKLEHSYGLIVDAVGDSLEAVVKPLPRQIRGLSMYAGTTVLSDGRPSLILESAAAGSGLRRLQPGAAVATPLDDESAAGERNQELLLTVLVADRRLALPVAGIRRLEQLDPTRIEPGGSGFGRRLQYHGGILPLVDAGERLGWTGGAGIDSGAGARRALVVCRREPHDVGLIVDSIGDIATIPAAGDTSAAGGTSATAAGLRGEVVLDGHVTDLVDLDWLLEGTT